MTRASWQLAVGSWQEKKHGSAALALTAQQASSTSDSSALAGSEPPASGSSPANCQLPTANQSPSPPPLQTANCKLQTERRHRFPLIFLSLLAITIFLPAMLKREVFTLRDHFDYFQPLRMFTAEELRAGRLPLWNPYSASGEPWLANPQTGVFYPPAWLFLALPFETAYMLYLLLHVVLLGCGAYLLFARRASPGAALVGAAALMFSGPVLSLLDVSNNFVTFAWIPLVLWCALEGAWRRGAIVLALAFLGAEPFFAALAALMYAIARRKRDVLWTGLIAFGLTAVQLIPFLEFVMTSDRAGGMEDALILRDSMLLRDWLQTIVPGPLTGNFIPVPYLGLLVIALAMLGVIVGKRAALPWLALLLAAFVLSLGPQWLTRLPLTLFRYPARLVPFAALAIAALAVIGWQRIHRPNRRWVDLLIVMLIVGDLVYRAQPLLATAPFRKDVVPYSRAIGTSGKILRFGDVNPREREAWISGYLNLYDRRFDAFTAAPLASEAYVRMYRGLLATPTFTSFANAGIVYILSESGMPPPWYPVTSAGSVHVFHNPQAFPMAAHFAPGTQTIRHASWTLDTSSAKLEVTAPTDGIVVLRQQAAPGWQVRVDGVPATSLVVDGLFRGVSVGKGHHEIIWKYDPPSLRAGAAITLATLFALQISVFVKRRRTRNQ